MAGWLEISCAAMLAVGALAVEQPPVAGEAEKVVAEIDAIKVPNFDAAKRGDRTYQESYARTRQELTRKRNDLILQLYKLAPKHPRVAKLLVARWNSTLPEGVAGRKLFEEIDEVINASKDPRLKIDGTYVKAQARIYQGMKSGAPDLAFVDEFLKLAPKDERGPKLLYMAYSTTKDEKAKIAIERRLLQEFTDTPFAAAVEGRRRQRLAVGRPFDLEFTDAIKGSKVSIKGLKGKVVVLDFWATWCGPCLAEMPHLKELYAKYHGRGVEFIGVSLDEPKEKGGLDKLKAYVTQNEIRWPQYYQGNGWASDFSKSWAIHSIPSMFVIDADGKLFSVSAQGKLETVLEGLLKELEIRKSTASSKR